MSLNVFRVDRFLSELAGVFAVKPVYSTKRRFANSVEPSGRAVNAIARIVSITIPKLFFALADCFFSLLAVTNAGDQRAKDPSITKLHWHGATRLEKMAQTPLMCQAILHPESSAIWGVSLLMGLSPFVDDRLFWVHIRAPQCLNRTA